MFHLLTAYVHSIFYLENWLFIRSNKRSDLAWRFKKKSISPNFPPDIIDFHIGSVDHWSRDGPYLPLVPCPEELPSCRCLKGFSRARYANSLRGSSESLPWYVALHLKGVASACLSSVSRSLFVERANLRGSSTPVLIASVAVFGIVSAGWHQLGAAETVKEAFDAQQRQQQLQPERESSDA